MQPQEVKEGKIDNVEHTNDEVKEPKKPRKVKIKKTEYVSQYTIKCVHIKRFDTVKQASDETEISAKHIIDNIYGRCPHAGGYRWGYDMDIWKPNASKLDKIVSK